MFYLIGQTVGQLQRLQGTGGRGPGNEVQISHQQQYLPVPFYVGTYNKKFGIQLGNEVWRNSCVERVLLCIIIVTCLYLTHGCVGALFHFWPFCALDIRW